MRRRLPQTTLTNALGKVHPQRITAALDRLRGTDMIMRSGVTPCVDEYEKVGEQKEPRIWRIRLHPSVIALVKRSADTRQSQSVPSNDLRHLSSRLSLILYSRWLGWLAGHFPVSRDIIISQDRDARSFRFDIPTAEVGGFFGLYGNMKPALIERLLLTKSSKCPLQRELAAVSVAVDTGTQHKDGQPKKIHSLRLFASAIVPKKLSTLNAATKHRKLAAAMRRAQYAALSQSAEQEVNATPKD